MVKIAPSLLSADFSRLKEELAEVEAAGADWIHVDVMDGHFVPNLTIGPLVVEAIRPHTRLPLDVHLMIEEPDRYIPAFAKSGADWITVHQEACPHLHRSVSLIAEQGVKAGVAINPATPVSLLEPILPYVDLVLVMTVNPGFGGQKLIPTALKKVEEVRRRLEDLGRTDVEIEVDGGIH
ncbi:MAG: ribulose-phosphate 3-epimerase, partial [Thermoactinomycetaceae bacterium]|nr:ribulose-phosphate 3-epimerase [Thermoactinomycetaceae bacterium]